MVRMETKNDEFIRRAINRHGNIYDYSLVKYLKNNIKVKIICPIHNIFEQTPIGHLSHGCSKCGHTRRAKRQRLNNWQFIKKSEIKHKFKYDYSQVEYITNQTRLKIICPIHGEFEQLAGTHLAGGGCDKCGRKIQNDKKRMDICKFISMAMEIHTIIYDYTKVDYKNNLTKVLIICPIHGEFEQSPSNHLRGSGCPECNISKGELKIMKYLDSKNIEFEHEYSFLDCLSPIGNVLRFDFYLPEHNLCIEYDGEFHYIQFKHITQSHFEKSKLYDKIKNEYCELNNTNLLRIPYTNFDDINKILENTIYKGCIKWLNRN